MISIVKDLTEIQLFLVFHLTYIHKGKQVANIIIFQTIY